MFSTITMAMMVEVARVSRYQRWSSLLTELFAVWHGTFGCLCVQKGPYADGTTVFGSVAGNLGRKGPV